MNILVVAAHPDDELLGMGGTLLRLGDQHAIATLILGPGGTDREEGAVERLRQQVRRAGRAYHACAVHTDTFPDNMFDTVPLLQIVKAVERRVINTGAEVVYTHHSGDLNIDHRITAQAVMTAARPGLSPVKRIYSFEVPSATEWGSEPFRPNVYREIDAKAKAGLCLVTYPEEMRAYPHPRSPAGLEALAHKRGIECGLEAAEAFELIREIA